MFSICVAMWSCNNEDKSNEILKQALDVYGFSELDDQTKVDSSLFLTNQSLELYGGNIAALKHLVVLRFRKKDLNGLIETFEILIDQNPTKPYYLGQKAIFLELKGEEALATEYYEDAFEKYEYYLVGDSLNFDLWMEYIGLLDMSGDTLLANMKLEKLKGLSSSESQKEMLTMYNGGNHNKKWLKQYWDGKIDYNQLLDKSVSVHNQELN